MVALVGVAIAVFQDDLRVDPPSALTQLRERVGDTVAEIAGVESESKELILMKLGGP